MKKRPLSVSISAGSTVFLGAVFLIFFFKLTITGKTTTINPMIIALSSLVIMGIGISLFRGKELGRLFYLWLLPAPIVYYGILYFSFFLAHPIWIALILFYAVGAFFLLKDDSNRYFGATPQFQSLKTSLFISLWFCFLTFPIMVIKVNTIDNVINWRFNNLLMIAISSFSLSRLWRYLSEIKETGSKQKEEAPLQSLSRKNWLQDKRLTLPGFLAIAIFLITFPFLFSIYHTNIMINALIYVMLGLGLNIVVGVAGLLDLGYVAFYAVGAYAYALLNRHFPELFGFWAMLPISAGLAAIFGILLGFPVLRLRGDYLAIVTLGFGEIIRLILENWNEFSFGPSGIANIPKPSFFGMELDYKQSITFIYFLMIALSLFTIFMVNRLQNSRIGRAWIALREDEVACQAMGIDKRKTKLTAFALGATWAGLAGCVFAAKTSFINPASFTIWESIIILCVVVLGGMGSIIGVIIGAFVLILLPEYLRAFSEFRMLVFGIILVSMMVFRPEGIIPTVRRTYQFKPENR